MICSVLPRTDPDSSTLEQFKTVLARTDQILLEQFYG